MRNAKTRGVASRAAAMVSAVIARGCDDRDRVGAIDGHPGHRVEGKEALHGMPYGTAGIE